MAKREYNGDPLDMSWNSGPWENDGETISATTDDDTGSMTTEDWPEGATPKEELNADEIEVIKTASKNRDITTLVGVTHAADIDRSDGYANYVLEKHWPEGKQQIMESGSYDSTKEEPKPKSRKPIEMAEAFRKEALDGSKPREIAEKFDVGTTTVKELLSGQRKNIDSKIPELTHTTNGPGGKWVVAGSAEVRSGSSMSVDGVRKYLLSGGSINELVKKTAASRKTFSTMARKRHDESEHEQPPLTYSQEKQSWVIDSVSNDQQQTLTDDHSDATDIDSQEIGHSVNSLDVDSSVKEQTTDQNQTLRQVALGFMALVFGYLLGRGK